MKDGLYEVSTPYMLAGFVVEQGQVTRCAPILRKRLDYWKSIARWIAPARPRDPHGCWVAPTPEKSDN